MDTNRIKNIDSGKLVWYWLFLNLSSYLCIVKYQFAFTYAPMTGSNYQLPSSVKDGDSKLTDLRDIANSFLFFYYHCR